MKFLDHTLLWDWCREHGYVLDEETPQETPRLAQDPTLTYRERFVDVAARDASAAQALASALTQALGAWDACLLWATDWDVWDDEEDWPRYYRWRGEHGERRSLGAAPGRLFTPQDGAALHFLLAHALECGWDLTLLPVRGNTPSGVRVDTSHDEWIEIRSAEPIRFNAPAV